MIQKILKKKRLLATIFLITLFYILILLLFHKFDINKDKINYFISQFGTYTALALFILQMLASITPLPDAILGSIAMVLLGPLYGGTVIWLGMYAAGLIHFFIARKLGKAYIIKKFPEVEKLISKVGGENVITKLTYLRMFMILTFDVPSYVAGISGATFWQFTISFLLGLLPHLISTAFITQGLLADGSILNVVPGIIIFLGVFIIANWPKRSKIK